MSMTELNSTARDLMSVRAMIAELEAEAEALTDKIKGAMVERGAEVLQGDGWKAPCKNADQSNLQEAPVNPGGGQVDYTPGPLQ